MKRWFEVGAMIGALLSALGCGRTQTFVAVEKGKIALAEPDRKAITELLEQTGRESSDLEIKQTSERNRTNNWIVIEGDRVVELAMTNVLALPPIQKLQGLERLRLWSGQFTDLAELVDLPNLQEVEIGNTPLEHLAGPQRCPQLRGLEIRRSALKTLDFATELPALEQLWILNAELEDLSGLEKVPALRELTVSENRLTTLEEVAQLPQLRVLMASDNRFADAAAVPSLPELENLVLGGSALRTLEGLPELPKLERLSLRESGLDELSLPVPLPNLRSLDVSRSPWLESLTPLDLPKLERIDLEDTMVADLDPLVGLESLTWVRAEGSPIAELPTTLEEQGVEVDLSPETEVQLTKVEMKRRIEDSLENFSEGLPSARGTMRRRSGKCSWSAGTFREAQVRCDLSIGSLEGLVPLTLHSGNPLSPTGGGPNRVYVQVQLSVESGKARAYVRTKIDYQSLAETLTGHRQTSDKLIEWGGPKREPGDVLDGFSYAEATRGSPAEVGGEAGIIAGEIIIWLAAIEGKAEGIRLLVNPEE